MSVMIGIDPHKASHTAVAIDGGERSALERQVRATRRQVDQLMSWAEPFGKRTWAIESAGGLGYLLAQQRRPATPVAAAFATSTRRRTAMR